MDEFHERAELLAALCKQIADHCRRYPNGDWAEGHLGIGDIIRRHPPEWWDEMVALFQQATQR